MPADVDCAPYIVAIAKYLQLNHGQCVYTEGDERLEALLKVGILPAYFDCSAFFTCCYSWAGAPNPNGEPNFNPGQTMFTGTLLDANHPEVGKADCKPSGGVVYGPGTGWHVAMVIEQGDDPLTISMGEQGDPEIIRVSEDGRQPQRFIQPDTKLVGKLWTPPGGPPMPFVPAIPPIGSAAALVWAGYRPHGPAPELHPNRHNDQRWVDYGRRLLQAIGYWSRERPVLLGGYGHETQGACVRFKTDHELAPDAIWGKYTWEKLGVFAVEQGHLLA